MWRSVGLQLSDSGMVIPSNDPNFHTPMEDDMICNAMVWLAMQVVNFVAAVKDDVRRGGQDGSAAQARLKVLSDKHMMLTRKLDIWSDGLPDSFTPACSYASGLTGQQARGVPNVWFVRPMCASTIQWYHFARIQLLHCRQYLSCGSCIWSPPGTTELRDLYRSVFLDEGRDHAIAIIGINLAQTDEGVLVHSVQPLFAAGQMLCLAEDAGEQARLEIEGLQACLIEHMRWISRETGWATEHRVMDLLELWSRAPSGWRGR